MVNGMFLTAFMREWNAEIVVEAAFDLLLSSFLEMILVFSEHEFRVFGVLLGLVGNCLGNDLKPLEEHELEFSQRKSLRSILCLRSTGKGFL